MNRRMLVAAAIVALASASTHAADRQRNQGTDAVPLPQTERRLELRALFSRAPGVIADNASGITAGPFQVDVIVARIDADGKLVKVCVDNEESARRFLEAPIGRVAGSRAQEK